MLQKHILTHSIDAQGYLESFLVSAVTTILIIRFYLHLTNYPQVGGGGLHVAHMLWGGILMVIAIIMLLSFLNTSVKKTAAIIGGIGFGTFIDELGKFITHDNNYFFEPTIAIIYVIFVLLFLTTKFINKKNLTEEESLQNAFEFTRVALLEMSQQSKQKALVFLSKCKQSDPITLALSSVLQTIQTQETKKSSITSKMYIAINSFYSRLIQKKLFTRSIVIFFILYTLYNLYNAIDVISLYFRLEDFSLSYIDLGEFVSSIVSTLVVIIGILRLRASHFSGYSFFKIAVLISIFLTQFFDFYRNQFSALYVLVINIFVLLILQSVINQKHLLNHETV